MKADPGIPLYELIRKLGFTADELLGELQSGRLLSEGKPVMHRGIRYMADPCVALSELTFWLTRQDVPDGLQDRVRAAIDKLSC